MHNPVTHYRFLLVRALADGEGEQEWLTGAGLVGHDLPGRRRLPAGRLPARTRLGSRRRRLPGLPRPLRPLGRGRRSGRSRTGRCRRSGTTRSSSRAATRARRMQLYGGDLDGITEHLDHVAAVGADVLYTTPVFPGESNHRYNATTFTEVDELLGGERGVRPAERRRPRAGLADPGRPHHQPHGRHPRVVPLRGRRPARPAPLLLLLRRRRHLRQLDGPRHAAEDQPRQPRRPPRDGRRARLRGRVAGCSRPTPSTGGASTSPT